MFTRHLNNRCIPHDILLQFQYSFLRNHKFFIHLDKFSIKNPHTEYLSIHHKISYQCMRCKRCWHIEIGVSHVHMTTSSSSSLWNEISHIYYVYSQKKTEINCKEEERKKINNFYVRQKHACLKARWMCQKKCAFLTLYLSHHHQPLFYLLFFILMRRGWIFLFFLFSIIIYFYALEKERNFLIVVVVDEISMMLGLESKM